MRLPRAHVYRAFPELDSFSDEKCRRFVREAGRIWGGRFARIALQGVTSLLVLVGSIIGLALLTEQLDPYIPVVRSDFWPIAGQSALGGVVLLASGLAFLGVRDVVLRRAVRRVMNRRGACPKCRYGLTSLPVLDGGVKCPECGTTVKAEAEVGEIVADTDGVPRFLPSPLAAPAEYRRYDRTQWRRILRWALATVGAAVVLLATAVGVFEWSVRSTIAAAERDGVKVRDFVGLAEKQGITASADGPDAPAALRELAKWITEQEALAVANDGGSSGVDYSALAWGHMGSWPVETQDENVDRQFLALAMLNHLRKLGLRARMDGVLVLGPSPRMLVEGRPDEMPLWQALMTTMSGYETRRLTEINRARMTLAREVRDREEFLSAFEASLHLGGLLCGQPSPTGWWFGTYAWRGPLREAALVLREHPDRAWVDGIRAVLGRQRPAVTFANTIEGARLIYRDQLSQVFQSPGLVRFGRLSPDYAETFGMPANTPWNKLTPLGSYSDNKRAADEYFTALEAYFAREPWQRGGPGAEPRLAALPALQWSGYLFHTQVVQTLEDTLNFARAVECMTILEQHRLASGAYPAEWAKVADAEGAPYDLWSGKPFGYRLVSEEPGYILYSVGPDLTDDGGRQTPRGAPGAPATSGVDLVYMPPPPR